MTVNTYEVAKQYVFWVEGLPHRVKGRISRDRDSTNPNPWMWEISHHYKPSENAVGPYFPSRVSAATIEEAEAHLFAYAKAFTNIGVKANDHF